MRRRWLVGVVGGLLLVGLAALVAVVPGGGPAEGFSVGTIWREPWGRGGVALVTGADGRRYGPLTFAVGRQRVVLADTFARRLLLVPLRGGAPAVVRFGARGPLVEDLALGRDGTVYLADRGGTLWRWRRGMAEPRPIARLGSVGRGLALVEGLGILPSGAPVVDLLDVTRRRAERSVFVLGPHGCCPRSRRRVGRATGACWASTAAGASTWASTSAVRTGGCASSAGRAGRRRRGPCPWRVRSRWAPTCASGPRAISTWRSRRRAG